MLLGGVALLVHYSTHPPGETAEFVAMPRWGLSHWLAVLAWPLILFGLVGWYVRRAKASVGWV